MSLSQRFSQTLFPLLIITGISPLAQAQQDLAGAEDHPLIQRIPDSWIKEYKTEEFDKYALGQQIPFCHFQKLPKCFRSAQRKILISVF